MTDPIRRTHRILALGSWAFALAVLVVQVWVLLDPRADSVRTIFPDWPHDPEYDGYLRGVAWADVLFIQPLFFVAGVGLWRMRKWAYVAGVAVGCVGVYFNVLQITAQLTIGGDYSLYEAGVFGTPFVGSALEPLMEWIGLLPFLGFPALVGVYCALKLRDMYKE